MYIGQAEFSISWKVNELPFSSGQ